MQAVKSPQHSGPTAYAPFSPLTQMLVWQVDAVRRPLWPARLRVAPGVPFPSPPCSFQWLQDVRVSHPEGLFSTREWLEQTRPRMPQISMPPRLLFFDFARR